MCIYFGGTHGLDSFFVSQQPISVIDQSVFALAVDRRSASLDERKISPVTAGSSVQ